MTRWMMPLLVLGLCLMLPGGQADSQILMVTGKYRVVLVDEPSQRIGVALEEDDPNVRQNWVYVKHDTKIVKRTYHGDGLFKDEIITPNGIWKSLKKGQVMKVNGGRDWDGSISAKKIWM